MTAFARVEEQTPIGKVAMEVRSVNNRYLDLGFRLSEPLKSLEPVLRERIGVRIKRGRVELYMRLESSAAAAETAQLNQTQLDRLLELQHRVRQFFPTATELGVSDILQWPGVLETEETDEETVAGIVLPLVDTLLSEFIDSRGREGAKLGDLIGQRIDSARQLVVSLQQKLPEINSHVRERLESRVADVLDRIDTERIEQEMVLLLSKSDVEEEIDRLLIHFDEVLNVLKQKQPLGRRLDFLMQELNREANTLGSKAAHAEVTNTSMGLKVLIEQMREQVQNLE